MKKINMEKFSGVTKNKWFKRSALVLTGVLVGNLLFSPLADDVEKAKGYDSLEAKHTELSVAHENLLKETEGWRNLSAADKEIQAKKLEEEKIRIEAEKAQREQAEKEKKAEEERLAQEQKVKEEADAKAAAEAESKKGAQSIPFKQLSRQADDLIGTKVQYKGKVVQIMDAGKETMVRLNITQDGKYWSDTIMVVVPSTIDTKNIFEDDIINVTGLVSGQYSYKTTIGGTMTIPSMVASVINK